MRIAFIKQKYVQSGGGERYLSRLMESCAERGDEIHLITTAWEADDRLPITTHIVSREGASLARRAAKFSSNVEELLKREQFDISFSLERTAYQDVWRAGEGVHKVWLERRKEMQPGFKNLLNNLSVRHRTLLKLEQACVINTPTIIANSNMVANDLRTMYGDAAGRIDVVYNGVDPRRFSLNRHGENLEAIRTELGLAINRPLLLMVGSGLLRKGLRETLQAMKLLPDCVLAVAGRESNNAWRRRVKRLGLADRLVFLGPRRNLTPYYHAADVVVLPSWFDPFPNAGLEALFCGTPLVTSAYAGVSEVVAAGETGEIVARPSEIEALAGAIARQIELGLSFERRQSISESVQDYTIENNRRRTLGLLQGTSPGVS